MFLSTHALHKLLIHLVSSISFHWTKLDISDKALMQNRQYLLGLDKSYRLVL